MVEGMSLAECTAASARPLGHGRLHLGDEDPLAADLIERGRRILVAPRADDDRLDLEAGVGAAQEVGDHLGLAQRERRPAGGQADGSHGPTIPWPSRAPTATAYRSKRIRSASTSRSPRGVPAVSFRSIVGSCSILASAALRRGVHLVPLLLAQVGQLRPVPLELGHAQRLEAGPQRRDDGRGAALAAGGAEALHLGRRRWRGPPPTPPARSPERPGDRGAQACPCRAA